MIDHELSRLSVLVVDDTASNRQILAAYLGKMGARVLQAEDGVRAVEMFDRHRPDVVLMDVMMPEMDGLEATRRIKAMSDYWVPVVFLSALGDTASVVAGLEAGGDDYVAKPFSFVVLNAKLRSLARTLTMQRRLDENRRLTQAILDNIESCVVTIDDTGKVLTANAATRLVFGYEPAELVGQNVEVLIPDTHRDAHAKGVRQYLGGGVPRVVGGERRLLPGLRRDGTGILLEIAVTEMRLDERRQFVGIMSDVSERVTAEQKLRQHAKALERYREDKEQENSLAAEILARLQHREGLRDPKIGYWLSAVSDFSGDVVAACRSPTGKLYALLADGTGHGLAAAISLLPVLTAFYGLAERDYPLSGIVFQMNRQLKAFMPTGRFVAAVAVCLDPEAHMADVWIGGMPDLLLVEADGALRRGFVERRLPLGIVDFDEESTAVQRIDCPAGSQFVLFSDGISELADPASSAFGVDRLASLAASVPPRERLAAIKAAVESHMAGLPRQDDISLLLIDC